MPGRRFPLPWSVEDIGAFVVKDSAGQKLGYFYYEEEPGRRSAAKMLSKDGCACDPPAHKKGHREHGGL